MKFSSITPLQLLSRPSQISVAPGWIAALVSLQSVPPHEIGPKPSPSPSAGGNEQAPVAAVQMFCVHALLSLQVTGVPFWQVPVELQVSAPLQRLPSEHDVPVAGVNTHPVADAQESVVHPLPSLQTSGAPATHAPAAEQVSSPLQALPSAHERPWTPTLEQRA